MITTLQKLSYFFHIFIQVRNAKIIDLLDVTNKITVSQAELVQAVEHTMAT